MPGSADDFTLSTPFAIGGIVIGILIARSATHLSVGREEEQHDCLVDRIDRNLEDIGSAARRSSRRLACVR